MQAKITSVYDEGSLEGTQLIGAKGFAVLIEIGNKTILFDTGRRGRYLLHNMTLLDIDPEKIDTAVISHGHASHTGGMEDLLRNRNAVLNVYAPSSAISVRKMGGPKGIRIPEDLSERARISEVEDWTEITDKAFISPPMDIGNGMTEVFMVLLSRKGPAVIAACSHAGVDRIMETVKERFGEYPRTYVGGVHIGKKEKEKANAIASQFSEKGCSNLHLNHCTGVSGMMYLRANLGLRGVSDFYVGYILDLEL